jgi:hypothetical protein
MIIREGSLETFSVWVSALDGAVNKRNLSTGETRESALELLAPQIEPGGWPRRPASPGPKLERSAAATIFEMFGITRVVADAAVKKNSSGS